ncbi:MAG: dual specificity protein phosphatase family protein [Sphingobacteriia bacterium]|nr:dual specificity protein phosphatase family protein [Sphingobacteriia bacterium]
MYNILKFLVFLLISSNVLAETAENYVFRYDITSFLSLVPKNFRIIGPSDILPNLEAPVSASGQFSERQLLYVKDLASKRNKQLVIIDLRGEPHGFINGLPVLLVAKKFGETVQIDKSKILGKKVKIYFRDSKEYTEVLVKEFWTEEELARKHDIEYISIKVRDLHKPHISMVKQFVDYLNDIPKNHWVHIHCRAGKGRTTTFLMIYTILNYSQDFTLEQMIAHHRIMGGVDLSVDTAMQKERIYRELALERAIFINNLFYELKKQEINGLKDDY